MWTLSTLTYDWLEELCTNPDFVKSQTDFYNHGACHLGHNYRNKCFFTKVIKVDSNSP